MQKLESFGLLYYNALVALPASVAIAWIMGEFEALAEFPYALDVVREGAGRGKGWSAGCFVCS